MILKVYFRCEGNKTSQIWTKQVLEYDTFLGRIKVIETSENLNLGEDFDLPQVGDVGYAEGKKVKVVEVFPLRQ